LVNAIPEWLYQFVEVIDGQIVRELIIERDVSVEDWTQVNARDEPINDIDPGIIIGPFILDVCFGNALLVTSPPSSFFGSLS